MVQVSPLAPIDPLTISSDDQDTSETEKKAPWIVRKLVGVSVFSFFGFDDLIIVVCLYVQSLTGRVITSSLESLKAVGASVTCLSAVGHFYITSFFLVHNTDMNFSGVTQARCFFLVCVLEIW